MMSETKRIKIGLAGLGTVGGGVYKHLVENRDLLAERTGYEFEVRRVAVRDPAKRRAVDAPTELITTRAEDLIEDPEIEIVVELMGGVDRAFDFVKQAVDAGKFVVTGNKALLAERGEEIFRLATERQAPVFFEAAVAGGIPIIKALRESFVGNHIVAIHGILNGTCNYILTRMAAEGSAFHEVLADAQRLGYAEADPTLDVSGWDAAHKAIILASLSYGFWVDSNTVSVEGIEKVTVDDIRFAERLGYVVKHVASIRADDAGEIEVQVQPTLIPAGHVLASVSGVFNAVSVVGDVVGETLFYGRGAGQDPTASSVISDLVDAARAIESGFPQPGFTPHGLYLRCKPKDKVVSQFYLRLLVEDRPGVMAQVASVLGENMIGISSVIQPECDEQPEVPLVFMLHDADGAQLGSALEGIKALACVKSDPVVFRVDHLQR